MGSCCMKAEKEGTGKIYYYHQDEKLSTTLLMNGRNRVRNQYQYDAYGQGLESMEELQIGYVI